MHKGTLLIDGHVALFEIVHVMIIEYPKNRVLSFCITQDHVWSHCKKPEGNWFPGGAKEVSRKADSRERAQAAGTKEGAELQNDSNMEVEAAGKEAEEEEETEEGE